jgi:hypothetical protein
MLHPHWITQSMHSWTAHSTRWVSASMDCVAAIFSFKKCAKILPLTSETIFFNPLLFASCTDTGSLRRRQSQQSFKTLTPFNFLFYSLDVSAPTGHPQVRYTISYLKDYYNTTDPLHVCIGILTCSPNTCQQIKHKKYNKNCKISKIPRY